MYLVSLQLIICGYIYTDIRFRDVWLRGTFEDSFCSRNVTRTASPASVICLLSEFDLYTMVILQLGDRVIVNATINGIKI